MHYLVFNQEPIGPQSEPILTKVSLEIGYGSITKQNKTFNSEFCYILLSL